MAGVWQAQLMQKVNNEPVSFRELLDSPGVEEFLELRGRFGFLAFHGGNLERRTEQIASDAAKRSDASFYGVVQPKGMRQHIPSKFVDPAHSSKLKSFIDHCEVVVAIHGYGIKGRWTDLLFGGQNRELAGHVAGHVRSSIPAYRCVDDLDRIPQRLRGVHPDNPVNRPVKGGVQIELPPRVRGLTPLVLHWPSHNHKEHRFPHMEHLIEGLADAARSWPVAAH